MTACRESLALARTIGDRIAEAHVLDSLGFVHRGLGEYGAAIDHYRQAVGQFEASSDRLNLASVWTSVGDAHADAQCHDAAHDAWRTALNVARCRAPR